MTTPRAGKGDWGEKGKEKAHMGLTARDRLKDQGPQSGQGEKQGQVRT